MKQNGNDWLVSDPEEFGMFRFGCLMDAKIFLRHLVDEKPHVYFMEHPDDMEARYVINPDEIGPYIISEYEHIESLIED